MDKQTMEFLTQKTNELINSGSVCKEAKEAAENWLKSVGTETEKEETAKDKEFYDLIFEKFPEIAPKSFVGFRRMKASNSDNYKKLLLKAEELLGYNFYGKQ